MTAPAVSASTPTGGCACCGAATHGLFCLACLPPPTGDASCVSCRGFQRAATNSQPNIRTDEVDSSGASTRDATRDPARAGVSEAEEQAEGRRLLTARGWRWWRVGHRNATGTQDAGVPDVVALREWLDTLTTREG